MKVSMKPKMFGATVRLLVGSVLLAMSIHFILSDPNIQSGRWIYVKGADYGRALLDPIGWIRYLAEGASFIVGILLVASAIKEKLGHFLRRKDPDSRISCRNEEQ